MRIKILIYQDINLIRKAISTIIILTFIPYIVPLILNFSTLGGDIFLLLLYNLIFVPFAKINFNIELIYLLEVCHFIILIIKKSKLCDDFWNYLFSL